MRKYLFYLLLSVLPFMGNGQLLNEGFEGTTFPPTGWTTFTGTNGLGTLYNWGRATATPYQGAGYAFVRYENVTGGIAEDWMVTPAIDLSDYENAELTFYTRQDFDPNWAGNYYVKVSTTSQTSHASFTDVATWTELTLNTTYNVYEQKTVDLSAYDGQTIYLAFVMTNDDGDSWYVDDVVVNADEVVVTPTGCLTTPSGQYPTATYTPPCAGGQYEIVADAWAGEYSRVNVTNGTEYTFSSSIATDFITISNATATTVYASGTGSVTWTAGATEVIRFITHKDAACTAENVNRSRIVSCGEPIALGEPTADCFQGDGGFTTLENGYGIVASGLFRVADDFVVATGTTFSLEEITMNILSSTDITTATLNIRADNAGIPGTVVNTVAMAPTSSTNVGTMFGFPQRRVIFDLATAFELTEGTYWLEVTATNAGANTMYWEVTSAGNTGSPLMLSADSGATWVADDSGFDYDAVFFVAGTCEAAMEGCLTASEGQYPSATFVPTCLGTVQNITVNAWAGEYSKVSLIAGTEYIFSVTPSTDFITIGDDAGTTVLAYGTGSVTYTPTTDMVVRFYQHVDDACTEDDSISRTRAVQCGEVPVIENPDFECFQGDGLASNGPEDGLNISPTTAFRNADDFIVADGTTFTVQQVRMNILSASAITNLTLNFRADNAGAPGAVEQTVTMAPSSSRIVAVAFGFNVYEVTLDLATAFEFEAGTYWLQPEATNQAGNGNIFWEMSSTGTTGAISQTSEDSGATWTANEFGYNAIFFVAGECDTVVVEEGCLEAENGLYPADTFTPECEGTPEEITALAWTGEYSNVQVTAGTEYTFSSSIDTDFVTIGNEDGTVVLASGVSSVTWTAPSDQVVRFYLHLDEACDWAATGLRSRIVQCGIVIPPDDYCEPVLDCTDGDVINNVTFAGINNDTDCSPNGYGDYTAMIAEVEAGETYSMSVTVGAGWTYEATMVWIDFNKDFIFDPVTEYFFIGSDPGTTNTADITIPAGTADGDYRLRVRVGAVNPDSNDLSILACDEDTVFGETEDYTLTVGEGGPIEECIQEVLSNELENGLFLGGADNQRLAIDITVDPNTTYTLETVEPTIIIPEGGEATTFGFIFYADEGGLPGTQLETRTGTITGSTVTGQNFGRDFIRYTVELNAPFEMAAGTYWMEMTSDAEGWEATTASVIGSTLVFNNASTSGAWVVDGTGTELVYKLIGTCEDLGVSEMESFDFAYYPNPVKDELNITSQKVVQSVSVYNLAGQQVSTQKLNVINGKISTSALAPGVYVFRAVLDGGQVETFKVIKK